MRLIRWSDVRRRLNAWKKTQTATSSTLSISTQPQSAPKTPRSLCGIVVHLEEQVPAEVTWLVIRYFLRCGLRLFIVTICVISTRITNSVPSSIMHRFSQTNSMTSESEKTVAEIAAQ